MKLAAPPPKYDPADQSRLRGVLERADADNLKRGVAQAYLLLSKPDGTVGRLTVDGTGAVIWTAL